MGDFLDVASISTTSSGMYLPFNYTTGDIGMANSTDSLMLERNVTPTMPVEAPTLTSSAIRRAVVLGVMAWFSIVGNIGVIVNIVRTSHRLNNTMYRLIRELAVADLLVSLFCLTAESAWTATVSWKGGNVLCKVVKFMQGLSLNLSTFVIVVIGLDRLIAIKYPMRGGDRRIWCYRAVGFVWFLSAAISIPQLFIFRVVQGPFKERFEQCVTYGAYTADWQEKAYSLFSLIIGFILPFIILLVSYCATFRAIEQSAKNFQENATSRPTGALNSRQPSLLPSQIQRQRILRKAKLASLKITALVVLAFLVCWTPYYTVMMMFIFSKREDQIDDLGQPKPLVSHWVEETIFFSGMSNSLVNPLIYGFFHLRKTKRRNLRYQEDGASVPMSEGTMIAAAQNGRTGHNHHHHHHVMSFRDHRGVSTRFSAGRGNGRRPTRINNLHPESFL